MLIGLVGKPSAGKSTFFKAVTLMDVARANYPFTTIKPNSGVGFVRLECVDKELGRQCNPREGYCINHNRFVPVQVIDVAGLVPGAHEGKGLGLEFLNDLSAADVLIHVVDLSGSLNEKGEPVDTGSYDPAQDVRFLEHELDMWYFQIFQRTWRKFSYSINQTKENVVKAIAKQFSGLKVTEEMVKSTLKELALLDKHILNWTDDDLRQLTRQLRMQTKPILIAANKMDIPSAKANLDRLRKEFPKLTILPCSAEAELALKEAAKGGLIDYLPGEGQFRIPEKSKLSDKQRKALDFVGGLLNDFKTTGVQQVVNSAVFDVLRYVAVFPGGVNKLEDSEGRVLPDCFLMPPGTSALDFAFHLHTDLGKGFIRAINVKTRMSMKKDEPLNHRDVIEIVHN